MRYEDRTVCFQGKGGGMGTPVVSDFGDFDRDLVLCGGPYSNLQAVEALADQAAGRPVFCTGDVVAYCADPGLSVDRVRALDWHVVAGNCERQIAEGGTDCGCGFDVGSTCYALAAQWFTHAAAHVSPEAKKWMAGLPDIGVFTCRGRRYGVVHGGTTAINRFIWPNSPNHVFTDEIAALTQIIGPVDGIVAGHSGIAFQREVAGVHWINAGVIGLPPHDGRPNTRYAVLKETGVVFERLSYDHRGAAEAMTRAGLTQGYEKTLLSGIWPSEDVLPGSLRR